MSSRKCCGNSVCRSTGNHNSRNQAGRNSKRRRRQFFNLNSIPPSTLKGLKNKARGETPGTGKDQKNTRPGRAMEADVIISCSTASRMIWHEPETQGFTLGSGMAPALGCKPARQAAISNLSLGTPRSKLHAISTLSPRYLHFGL